MEVIVLYSPKISEDLIPKIYELARNNGKPMTKVVDELLRPKVVVNHARLTLKPERSENNGSKH